MGDTYTSQGKGSVNISGQTIQVNESKTTIVNAPLSSGGGYTPVEAERTVIWKFPLSVNQLLFSGLIGVAPSYIYPFVWFFSDRPSLLFSVISTIPNFLFVFTLLVFGVPLLIGMVFKFASCSLCASLLGNLECSADGGIYYTRIRGVCPHCFGPMRMVAKHHLSCPKNIDHMIKFDMTTLPDVAEDYARRRRRQDDRPTHEDGDKTTREPHNDEAAREECSDEIENV